MMLVQCIALCCVNQDVIVAVEDATSMQFSVL
jgi:hypothetical protein